ILGTISGVVLAALFGELACGILRINGFSMYTVDSTVEALLQIKQGQPPLASLQIGDLLVGGILIAALGAVNDVAMSISSSMNELISVNPNLSRKELFRSGMNIGRDMVGTMTNTLILALVGSSLVIIIYLCSLEPSFPQLMSSAFFSVEMVQMLASSAGVILAVPLSVFFGMLFFGRKKRG
ncbi:MAG: YibE/F family protein, partial [Oscillospiraceae bacterium]|nr:YibE/F family protein [Oscillospiraceae bacterium]